MTRDEYHLSMCNAVAANSKCLSRKIGAILVRDNCILVTGYNGPPKGVPHCGEERLKKDAYLQQHFGATIVSMEELNHTCPRQILGAKSGERLDLCPAGHAERNVLITAARHGIKTNHATMYMNCPIPCSPCLIEIINAGIKEIVVTEMSFYDKMSVYLLNESDLLWRTYN